jgi:glycosyltransferase involved in cell wall biosynthesis
MPLTVHCELAPVLVNRTAVYRMCRESSPELSQRGFAVRPFALLGALNHAAEAEGWWGRQTYSCSERLLHWTLRHPRRFLTVQPFINGVFRRMRRDHLPVLFDPLYLLFHGELVHGVVLVYDTTPITNPIWHTPAVAQLYRKAFDLLSRSGCHVVASSQNTADHLRVNHGVTPSRLTVLPLGLFQSALCEALDSASNVAEPFLLFVGSLEPRKNIRGLLGAYRRADLYRRHGVRLRLIGSKCDPSDPAIALASGTPGVDLLGYVDEPTLNTSYRQCLGFVYPSFCEGFGLPLLEAMSHGCACCTTLAGASPELGGDAVLYLNPHSEEEIAASMCRLAEMSPSQRHWLGEHARRRAQGFTWQKFYDALAGVLRGEAERCFDGSGAGSCGAAA